MCIDVLSAYNVQPRDVWDLRTPEGASDTLELGLQTIVGAENQIWVFSKNKKRS